MANDFEVKRAELEAEYNSFGAKYGFYYFAGTQYAATAQPELTNRAWDGGWTGAADGDDYTAEWSAPGVDKDGLEVVITWHFEEIKGQENEPENLNWDVVEKVRYA